jgi:hypothetical protein
MCILKQAGLFGQRFVQAIQQGIDFYYHRDNEKQVLKRREKRKGEIAVYC